jgi:hypothetical protein
MKFLDMDVEGAAEERRDNLRMLLYIYIYIYIYR